MADQLKISVLGELRVTRGNEEVALPPSKKTRALLAYLAVVGRPQRRERLCELFWDVPDDPRGALRWSLSKLRQVLGSGSDKYLKTDRNTVTLTLNEINLDWVRARTVLRAERASAALPCGFRTDRVPSIDNVF